MDYNAETLFGDVRGPDFQVVVVVDNDDGRMFPLTEDIPRCLLPIANRTLLAYQLDLLRKHHAAEIFVVAGEEYIPALAGFLTLYKRDDIETKIDLIAAGGMTGSADALRAVKDRIRGDFVVMSADVLTDCSLGALVNFHRLHNSDVTTVIASSVEEETDRKGASKKMIDEEDQDYIGTDQDGRLLFKMSALDIEGSVSVPKALLHRCEQFHLRNNASDCGIYVMSWWIMEFLMRSPRLTSLRTDVIPYLVARQFQPERYLLEHVPGLEHRRRPLAVLESWLNCNTSTSSCRVGSELSEHMIRPSTIIPAIQSTLSLESSILNNSAISDPLAASAQQDMLRCYSMFVDTSSATPATYSDVRSGSVFSAVCKRITNLKSYMNINRDLPQLFTGPAVLPWARMQGYSKKEQSVIGERTELADKVTMKQCNVGAGCRFGTKSRLNNCVIMDGAIIGESCTIQNSVICAGAILENGCSLNDCYIGAGATVAANTKLKSESISSIAGFKLIE